MRTIGENIRYYRKRAGLMQKELAREVGCSVAAISTWERDLHDPPALAVVSLCEALGVTPGELLGWKEQMCSVDTHNRG
jgi:transcriptional regulator with XRE-family HTH domain